MKITSYVEEHIFTGKMFSRIFSSQQSQIDKHNNQLDDLLKQAYIHTATWGLKYWEEEFGIKADENDSLENRRARCLAALRGRGNCTIDYIKEVALSYDCGDIDILEDFENYTFTVKLLSKVGIPPKMEDFRKTLRLISPAHLLINYEFTYNTVYDLRQFTVAELSKYTTKQLLEKRLGV